MAKQVTTTGTLTISLDASQLEATAVFTPGEGETWSPERLIAEMRSRGIVEGFKPDDLRRTFALVLEQGKGAPFVIARGTRPLDPKPERARFLDIGIPTDLQAQADQVLADAAAPQITVEKKERRKREKLVTKKAPLPFLPAREQKVRYTEETVHRERIYVDPTVERTGYATAGQKIGMVEGKDDGQAGRSVAGDLVLPPALADPLWYAGEGVERRRDELFASYDGFVRIGANWADIVPFDTHDWELTLSPDMATLSLSFDPGHAHAKAPSAEEVAAEAERLGYPTARLPEPDEITSLINEAMAARRPLRDVPLSASRDASFEIYVSEDKRKAVLTVHKGTGRGRPLNLKELGAAIRQSKLVRLDYEKIKADISSFYRSTDIDLTGYVLAEGSSPLPGPQRSLDFSVRFMDADEAVDLIAHLKRTLRSDGASSVDSASSFPADEIEDVGRVEENQRIVTISPPVPGKPGVDVHGQQTPGESAPEPAVELYENLERKGHLVIATTSGMLHRGWREGTVLLRVLPHGDASVTVRVTENRMAALLSLHPGRGTGRSLEYGAVDEAIREKGISSGIREELVMRAWELVGSGREIRDLIFARGRHLSRTTRNEVEVLITLASGKGMTIQKDGRADFRNQDRITTVRRGTQIARVRPAAAPAEEGWDVLGNKLRAEESDSLQIDAGANVAVTAEADGSQLLTAQIDGELVFEHNRFEIRPAFAVNGDVDLHTGNIRFPGSVTVKGSVRSGFHVMAGGDIQVGELVEASLLSADGEIVINQGVKGGGKAVVRTKRAVGLTFAEQATILAVGNVQARNSLVHCEVKTNGKLRMIGDGCRIVGGRIRAREGLETHNLGSERGVKTLVEFGQDYLIADRIEREEREMEKLKREVSRVDLAMRESERDSASASLDKLHRRKLEMLKLLEQRGLRVFTYRERFEEHHESQIVVTGTLYPGVLIETHGRQMEITSPRKSVVITFNAETGRIEERDARDFSTRERRATEEASGRR